MAWMRTRNAPGFALVAVAVTVALASTACAAGSAPAAPAATAATGEAPGAVPTGAPTTPPATPPTPRPSPPPTAAPTAAPSAVPRSAACAPGPAARATAGAGVTLRQYSDGFVDAQIELTDSTGMRVFIDVGNAEAVSRPPRAGDVLVTTHDHPDHVSTDFIAAFPGHYVAMGDGLVLPWVRITNVDSAHGSEGGPARLREGKPFMVSNHIYVVEIGGLRIVHFGDLGQTALTRSQLDAIGRVDVAIAQLDNPYSGIGVIDHIGYDLMRQVCPLILVPTHMLVSPQQDAALAASTWPAVYSPKDAARITPASLPDTTTVLFLGARGARLGRDLGLARSPW